MIYLRLLAFSLRHLARLSHWQAAAEITGSDTARQRASAHDKLRIAAATELRRLLKADLGRLTGLQGGTQTPR